MQINSKRLCGLLEENKTQRLFNVFTRKIDGQKSRKVLCCPSNSVLVDEKGKWETFCVCMLSRIIYYLSWVWYVPVYYII